MPDSSKRWVVCYPFQFRRFPSRFAEDVLSTEWLAVLVAVSLPVSEVGMVFRSRILSISPGLIIVTVCHISSGQTFSHPPVNASTPKSCVRGTRPHSSGFTMGRFRPMV